VASLLDGGGQLPLNIMLCARAPAVWQKLSANAEAALLAVVVDPNHLAPICGPLCLQPWGGL